MLKIKTKSCARHENRENNMELKGYFDTPYLINR